MSEYQENKTNLEGESANEQGIKNEGTQGLIDLGGDSGVQFDPFASDVTVEKVAVQASEDISETEGLEEISEGENTDTEPQNKTEEQTKTKVIPLKPGNPFDAAISETEEKNAEGTKAGLIEKPPVFEYAGVSEAISDSSVTFEELRSKRAEDFPELDDAARVTWTVTYGKIIKNVTNPKNTTVAKQKSDIEQSKDFLEALKKCKGDVVCKISPKVTSQKKGLGSSYKGIFNTLEEAETSGKAICILPSDDGNVYEMRKNEVGCFTTKLSLIKGLSKVRAGFTSALPLIPEELIFQAVSFFRSFMNEKNETEALLNLYWNKLAKEYFLCAPKQIVSKYEVKTDLSDIDAEICIHVAEIHSHNSMKAEFSATDDNDEKASRIYIVIGRLNRLFPTISARVTGGGGFVNIDPNSIIESIMWKYPAEWRSNVTIEKGTEAVAQ